MDVGYKAGSGGGAGAGGSVGEPGVSACRRQLGRAPQGGDVGKPSRVAGGEREAQVRNLADGVFCRI